MTTQTAASTGGSLIVTVGTITTGIWNGNAVDVSHGGTGQSTLTAYAPLCGGTTTTGVVQSASTGQSTTGLVFTSNGSSALPSFQAPAQLGLVVNQNSSSVTMSPGRVYLINNGASLVTLTLATSPTAGDVYYIIGSSSGGFKIAQNASQFIRIVNSGVTTTGVGGSITSNTQYDCIGLIKTETANEFVAFLVTGTPTYV